MGSVDSATAVSLSSVPLSDEPCRNRVKASLPATPSSSSREKRPEDLRVALGVKPKDELLIISGRPLNDDSRLGPPVDDCACACACAWPCPCACACGCDPGAEASAIPLSSVVMAVRGAAAPAVVTGGEEEEEEDAGGSDERLLDLKGRLRDAKAVSIVGREMVTHPSEM